MIHTFKTSEEAEAEGYISIQEAIQLKPAARSTYHRQAENGTLPACQVLKKSRPVWYVLQSALLQVEKSGVKNYLIIGNRH
jgi:hypothetical protein